MSIPSKDTLDRALSPIWVPWLRKAENISLQQACAGDNSLHGHGRRVHRTRPPLIPVLEPFGVRAAIRQIDNEAGGPRDCQRGTPMPSIMAIQQNSAAMEMSKAFACVEALTELCYIGSVLGKPAFGALAVVDPWKGPSSRGPQECTLTVERIVIAIASDQCSPSSTLGDL